MELYHLHVAEDDIHTKNEQQSKMIYPQFNEIHVIMMNPIGLKGIIAFLTYKRGINLVTNCADFWALIQEYKKVEHKSALYNKKIVSMYELFVDDDSMRLIDFNTLMVNASDEEKAEIAKMKSKLTAIQFLAFDGFYHHKVADKSSARAMLGLRGRQYVAWSDESSFLPSNPQ